MQDWMCRGEREERYAAKRFPFARSVSWRYPIDPTRTKKRQKGRANGQFCLVSVKANRSGGSNTPDYAPVCSIIVSACPFCSLEKPIAAQNLESWIVIGFTTGGRGVDGVRNSFTDCWSTPTAELRKSVAMIPPTIISGQRETSR